MPLDTPQHARVSLGRKTGSPRGRSPRALTSPPQNRPCAPNTCRRYRRAVDSYQIYDGVDQLGIVSKVAEGHQKPDQDPELALGIDVRPSSTVAFSLLYV